MIVSSTTSMKMVFYGMGINVAIPRLLPGTITAKMVDRGIVGYSKVTWDAGSSTQVQICRVDQSTPPQFELLPVVTISPVSTSLLISWSKEEKGNPSGLWFQDRHRACAPVKEGVIRFNMYHKQNIV